MGVLIVFLHTTDGHPIAFHIGRDRIFATGNGPVVAEVHGTRFEVKETKAQIEAVIRDAEY